MACARREDSTRGRQRVGGRGEVAGELDLDRADAAVAEVQHRAERVDLVLALVARVVAD
jgi:hypothetical protein